MLDDFEKSLVGGYPAFKLLSPSPKYLISSAYPVLMRTIEAAEFFSGWYGSRKAGMSYAQMLGDSAGYKFMRGVTRPARRQVINLHLHMPNVQHDFWRKNGIGGRSWITRPGMYKMVIVFHDANRAGPHIDVHIGRLSLIYRVKPDLYEQLKYNSDGFLTAKSQELLIAHVKSEIANGSRVPQNLDHSMTNARATWTGGVNTETHYGAGITRQVVSVSPVEVYKAHDGGPIEFYAPLLSGSRPLYLYRLYPGEGKRAPICIWGEKKPDPPKMEERLHLKLVHPENIADLEAKADMETSTAKYDGSSAYFRITPKGTTVWSPRTSKRSGHQIEYTHKLRGIPQVTSDQEIVGMGEIVFVEKTSWWKRDKQYLPQSVGSGLLNANAPLPRNVRPMIKIYRIDRVGRKSYTNVPFWDNRVVQERVALLDPAVFQPAELMDPLTARERGFEGVVAVPHGGSVNDGFKVKWWTDPHDWRIDEVAFTVGPSGKVAGVVHAVSLESGKKFKLGPGQVGNEALTRDMMTNPHKYEGSVIKVQSRHGHEGRASKLIDFHDDKGISVYD